MTTVTVGSEERLRDADILIDEFITRVTADIEQVKGKAFDPGYVERFRETAQRLSTRLNEELPPDLDVEAVAEIRGILIEALQDLSTIDEERPWDVVEVFILRAEAIRHIVRDALDAHVGSDGQNAADLIRALQEWLPRVPQTQLAELVDISPRQLQRWKKSGGEPPRRLQLVTRLVALLHRAWTPEGVLAWFDRPRSDLDGQAPRAVLDDHAYEQRLIRAVRQGRAQHGS
jgi:hypothetical protein